MLSSKAPAEETGALVKEADARLPALFKSAWVSLSRYSVAFDRRRTKRQTRQDCTRWDPWGECAQRVYLPE